MNLSQDPPGIVISTKAEGRVEKSACEREAPSLRCQMSRLRWRFAPKKMAIVEDGRNGCKYLNHKNLCDKCCMDAIFFLTPAAKRRSDST
jgi:hypothetical protein